jgi:hypothetical protein
MNPTMAPARSKTFAAWLALLGGSLGAHRFYLFGFRDKLAWLHPIPTLLGYYGVQRMQTLGQDDRLAWLLIPLLGLMLAAAALQAIVFGLTADEKWDRRYNDGHASNAAGWLAVTAVVLALMVGGISLMATLAFSSQRYFESQIEAAKELSQ